MEVGRASAGTLSSRSQTVELPVSSWFLPVEQVMEHRPLKLQSGEDLSEYHRRMMMCALNWRPYKVGGGVCE